MNGFGIERRFTVQTRSLGLPSCCVLGSAVVGWFHDKSLSSRFRERESAVCSSTSRPVSERLSQASESRLMRCVCVRVCVL
jgi:hypothetical protein